MIGREQRRSPDAGGLARSRSTFAGFVLALLGLLLVGGAGAAQEDAAAVQQLPAPAPTGAALPDPLEITTRLRALTDSAALAERQIASLAHTEALLGDLALAQQRQQELRQLVVSLGEAEFVRADRIARVRNQALQEEQRLAGLDERAAERLGVLGQLRSEWAQRQRFWLRWQEALRADPEYTLFAPEITQALDLTEAVRARVAEVLPEMLTLQREIQSLRLETAQIIEQASSALLGRRAALLRQDQPPLFTSAFMQQLRSELRTVWYAGLAAPGEGYRNFFRDQPLLPLIHVVLVIFLALIARRLRQGSALAEWAEVLQHPWSAALFASTALVAQQYALAPPLVEMLVWTLLAGSGAMLARLLIGSRALRLMVYCFSAFYPLFLLAEAIWLPPSLFQLGLAALATLGLASFAALVRRSARSEGERPYARWVIGFGAAMWAVVLFAELVGYHRLARWVIHAAVTSALVLFVVGFLVIVARGLIWTLLSVEASGRLRVFRTVGVPIAGRFLTVVQLVLIGGALLALLNIWELAPPPLESWALITALGFSIAGVEVTIGRILFAFALVYAAVLASWTVRTFVASEVVPRWDLERGVGDSITAVIHYLVIAIGVLFALGALGVHLQNFAIVAGALSLGIGFGLQNIVNNFVSGIILLFERPVRVGDTVVIDGEWGTIKKIGLRSTVVETFDRSEMIVPNGDLVSEKVINWTLSNPIARLALPIGVAYGSPVASVLQILKEAATAHPAVLEEPSPQALFVGFGDNSLDFELRLWVRELRLRLEVKSLVLEELDRRFRDAGIGIPFPQRDLHLRSLDPAIVEALRRAPPERLQEAESTRYDGA
jgi:potassium-dependent mechanosensitive channel